MCAFTDDGVLVDSGRFTGMTTQQAQEELGRDAESNGWGRVGKSYKLRDWLVSRQRYWGAPIPMIHCTCERNLGPLPVPEKDLPVALPEVDVCCVVLLCS